MIQINDNPITKYTHVYEFKLPDYITPEPSYPGKLTSSDYILIEYPHKYPEDNIYIPESGQGIEINADASPPSQLVVFTKLEWILVRFTSDVAFADSTTHTLKIKQMLNGWWQQGLYPYKLEIWRTKSTLKTLMSN